MKDENITYRTVQASISEGNMQFHIVNRYPCYSAEEKETVRAEIERQLFTVFCRDFCLDL